MLEIFIVGLLVGLCAGNTPTYISGELSGVLRFGDYIVTNNIYVSPRDTLRIEGGVILRFESYSGLIVRGSLICEGTNSKPVVFTSVKDNASDPFAGKPASFDWNGVSVEDGAEKIKLVNTSIRYSVFGLNIKSKSTGVILENAIFYENGYRNFARAEKVFFIEAGVPFSYMSEGLQEDEADEVVVAGNKDNKGREMSSIKLTGFITSGIGIMSGTLLWTIGHYMAESSYSDYQQSSSSARSEMLRNKIESLVVVRNVGITLLGFSAVGLAISFAL